jgi:hypothetical protein
VNHLIQDCVGRLTIGVSVKIQDDAMPEHGKSDGADIVDAQVYAAMQQCEDPAALDQRLRPSRRASIAYVFVGDLVRTCAPGLRSDYKINGEVLDMLGHQNFAARGAG